MHCTNCGSALDAGAKFCPACGFATAPRVGPQSTSTRLVRPRSEKRIAGVCAGIARNIGWDVTLVRILWVLLIFGAGTGVLAYIIAWIVIPAGD